MKALECSGSVKSSVLECRVDVLREFVFLFWASGYQSLCKVTWKENVSRDVVSRSPVM